MFQRFGEPIEDRYREQEERPQAFNELGKKIQFFLKILDAYKQNVIRFFLTVSIVRILLYVSTSTMKFHISIQCYVIIQLQMSL